MTDELKILIKDCCYCYRPVVGLRGECLLVDQKVVTYDPVIGSKAIVAGTCPNCGARYDRRGGWRQIGYQRRGTGASGAPMLSSAPVSTEPTTEAGR